MMMAVVMMAVMMMAMVMMAVMMAMMSAVLASQSNAGGNKTRAAAIPSAVLRNIDVLLCTNPVRYQSPAMRQWFTGSESHAFPRAFCPQRDESAAGRPGIYLA